MRYWISFYFLLAANLLVGQKNERLDFLDSISEVYPGYDFVYLNDNYQISQFTVYKEHITLLLSSWSKGGKNISDIHFLLLAPNSQLTLDTLTFQKTLLQNNSKHFYYNESRDSLLFRPMGGYLSETGKPFFDRLSISIPINQQQFLPYRYVLDSENISPNLFVHFMNPENLRVKTDKKTSILYINKQQQEIYHIKKIAPQLKLDEPIFYENYFPYILTEKQLIVLDLLGDQLIFANKKDIKKQQVKNLDDLKNSKYRYELLFDEVYQNLYLKIGRGTKAELYKLVGDEFKLLNVKLPRFWDYDGLGSNHATPTFINNGKLYTVLSINQNGRQLDGIFMLVL